MVNQISKQVWGAARLMLDPGRLIDKFLDWIENVSGVAAVAAAQADAKVPFAGAMLASAAVSAQSSPS